MYKVLVQFFDLQDNAREYHPGDTFPRDGFTVSAKRLEELASSRNRLGSPVISEVEEQPEEQLEEQPEEAEKPTRKRGRKNAD